MPKIILTRHGQTDYNAQRRYQGQIDIPLNATGLKQAEALRHRLAKVPLTVAFCSDLGRAQTTAEIALEGHPSGLKAKSLAELREVNGGLFEGLTWQEQQDQYPEELKLWRSDPYNYGTPGGENLKQAIERITRAFNQIVEQYPKEDDNILIVAHGGPNNLLLCHLMGMELNSIWKWRFDNCAISLVDIYNGKEAILSSFNDTAHLSGLLDGTRI